MKHYLLIKDTKTNIDYKIVTNEDAMKFKYRFNNDIEETPDLMVVLPDSKEGLEKMLLEKTIEFITKRKKK